MGFQLVIAEGKEAGKEFVFEQASVVIGRTSECDVVLYDPGVSRKHARIFSEAQGYFVEDMGSSNGTLVNGALIRKQQLNDGDSVTLGPVVFNFAAMELVPDEEGPPKQTAANSTRIVSVEEMRRQRNKGSALAPKDAEPGQLSAIRKSETKSMQAVSRPRAPGTKASGSNPNAEAIGRGPSPDAPSRRPSSPAALEKAKPQAVVPPAPAAAPDALAPRPPSRPSGLDRARSSPGGPQLSAAERARLRREAKGAVGKAQVFWAEASAGTRKALALGLGALALAAVAVVGVQVARSNTTTKLFAPSPSALSRQPLEATFGLGEVDHRHSDSKEFEFEVTTPTRAVVVLRYRSLDISQGEVTVAANGAEVGMVPADTLGSDERIHQLVIFPKFLKPGTRNTVLFDNTFNPPKSDPWQVGFLSVETLVLPVLSPDEMTVEARQNFDRGQRTYEQREIGAGNLYEAWKNYRTAWLVLVDHPDPKPELFALAYDKMRATQGELDNLCAKLMLEAASNANQKKWEQARHTLDHVRDYFPTNEQSCPALAEKKYEELGL